MKAVRIHETGGPEVLHCEEVPRPAPGPGQALVRLHAAGVNFLDIYHRTGLNPLPLPAILGNEGAGVVEAIGPGVTEVAPGDRVAFTNVLGSYAEFVVAPAWRLVPIPGTCDFRQAAAAMLQGMTAHYLTHTTYPLRPGEWALVHAAAGGVGALLVQLARRRGARVIATVSTEEKAAVAREAGADVCVIYTREDFVQAAKQATEGAGVQVVYDSVGKDTFERGLDCLAVRGVMVLYGQASGPVAPVDPRVLNAKGSLFLTRPSLHHYTRTRAELLARAGDVLQWVQDGSLRLRIDRTYPLAEAAEAHRRLEGRAALGKLLLVP
ncbi:MAG: quinone oxidoreductase [Armatimonadota bacterium]|nr:quinone oxidoreductase [Armatimonadota bacterium]MDR7557954.1 quinone oxidoreductase [Armatimonadota bacterium]